MNWQAFNSYCSLELPSGHNQVGKTQGGCRRWIDVGFMSRVMVGVVRLSFRDVEEMMLARGVVVTYGSIRQLSSQRHALP